MLKVVENGLGGQSVDCGRRGVHHTSKKRSLGFLPSLSLRFPRGRNPVSQTRFLVVHPEGNDLAATRKADSLWPGLLLLCSQRAGGQCDARWLEGASGRGRSLAREEGGVRLLSDPRRANRKRLAWIRQGEMASAGGTRGCPTEAASHPSVMQTGREDRQQTRQQ